MPPPSPPRAFFLSSPSSFPLLYCFSRGGGEGLVPCRPARAVRWLLSAVRQRESSGEFQSWRKKNNAFAAWCCALQLFRHNSRPHAYACRRAHMYTHWLTRGCVHVPTRDHARGRARHTHTHTPARVVTHTQNSDTPAYARAHTHTHTHTHIYTRQIGTSMHPPTHTLLHLNFTRVLQLSA